MTLIQVVKDLFEKELFEDLIFYVELHLEPHNLEDELEKNEIVMLWKYVGDAHYQLDQYNPAVRVSVLINNNNIIYFFSVMIVPWSC